jgi:hypothetical protein
MDTNPNGSGPLDVNSAANAILGMMADEGEEPTQQPQEETQEVQQEQVEETPRYRVKAAGEEREVTIDELIKSYQLGTDYTQKTQALAEQRKAVEAEKAAVEQAKQLRDQYAQRLELIQRVLAEQNKPENIEALKETDPIGYAVKMAEQMQRKEQLAAVQAEQQRLAHMRQAEQQQALQAHLAQEAQKLSQFIPEFSQPEKADQVRADIRNYAKQIGFTDQELANVYDSRAVLALWKAAQYDKLVSQGPKKVTQAPPVLKSGAAKTAQPETESYKAERNRLRKSGKARDAASLFEKFL